MRASSGPFAGLTVRWYEDTDFDIVDVYELAEGEFVMMFEHSHGTAELAMFNGVAWVDMKDMEGKLLGAQAANVPTILAWVASAEKGEAGAIRAEGSGVDNSTLRLLIGKI